MLDGSVFTNADLLQNLISSKRTFHVSATLYSLLYERYDFETVHQTLNYFRRPEEWNAGLPAEKLLPDLRALLRPYQVRSELIDDVFRQSELSALPVNVKRIILEEWSFMKEHSSLLLIFDRAVSTLHQWGVVVLDATNQVANLKTQLLQPLHGIKVLLGIAVAIAALRKTEKGNVAAATAWGGVALALFDP